MPVLVFELLHQAPFHAGLGGELSESAETIPSDTLWGALCDTAHFIKRGESLFGNLPSIRVSSVFPRCGRTRFLPMPFLPVGQRSANADADSPDDPAQGKKWKKVKYVSEAVFDTLVQGLQPPQPSRADGFLATDGESARLPETIIENAVIPANTLDRLTNNASPWQRAEVSYNTAEGCGSWFLVSVDEKQGETVTELVTTLGERGIGGERSAGRGRFQVEKYPDLYTGPLALEAGNHSWFITLSRYLPTKEEVDRGLLDNAAYNTVVRGGFCGGFRKRKMRLCLEGGAFRADIMPPPYGKVKNVAPEAWKSRDGHPLWLCGMAFPAFYTPQHKEVTP